ncbi:U11/U12 small nuclear ribonucleoprotein 25 kDa protein-like [Triticum aestivum]|uniref:U11/U12 small nuclear ribonucleoprotein 25 kDa protein-like n=1 Tax=Triticum aestivum TaxID=4565 RepID=UPI001D01EEB1|nr:U11/U12 small nuclear ribonucleoprotein 25 kDa protein-like [Triticum aestivum]
MDSAGASKPDEEVAAYQSSEAKQARLQSMVAALLDDPILADLLRKPPLADVDTLINLELGTTMRVTVVNLDNTSFGIIWPSSNPAHIFVQITYREFIPHLNSCSSCRWGD